MPLYGVKCINHIILAGDVQEYEESIVVVEASSDAEAKEAAAKYSIGAQTLYLNEDGETVEWVFYGTEAQTFELVEPLTPPVEVYSSLHTYHWKRG